MTNEEIACKITEHDGYIDRHEGRIKALEAGQTALNKMATSVAVLAEQMKNNTTTLYRISADVDEIKGKPAKRWESVAMEIIKVLAAAVLGILIGQYV